MNLRYLKRTDRENLDAPIAAFLVTGGQERRAGKATILAADGIQVTHFLPAKCNQGSCASCDARRGGRTRELCPHRFIEHCGCEQYRHGGLLIPGRIPATFQCWGRASSAYRRADARGWPELRAQSALDAAGDDTAAVFTGSLAAGCARSELLQPAHEPKRSSATKDGRSSGTTHSRSQLKAHGCSPRRPGSQRPLAIAFERSLPGGGAN